MKKVFALVLVASILLIGLVSCGEKSEVENDGNQILEMNNEEITHETKVSNLSESYAKYVEIKSRTMETLSEKLSENGDFSISMALLGASMVDLMAIPATVCGLGEVTAQSALGFLYSGVKYTEDGNKYIVEFNEDEEGNVGKFVAEYDVSTDSAHMEYLKNDKWFCTVEYIKIDNGYGSLYIAEQENTEEVNSAFTVYKSIYVDDNVFMGFLDETGIKPDSIYKNASLCTEEWAKEDNNWIEFKNGVEKAVFNENETNF